MSGWNTLDLEAGVFSELVDKLGVRNVEINDVYSLDSALLAALAPVYGVIFLFKWKQGPEGPLAGVFDTEYMQNGVFFANQTINNACGTIAVLNTLLNRPEIDLGPELGNFKEFIAGFDLEMVGETISNSELVRTVHNSFLAPPSLHIEDNSRDNSDADLYHFVAYTPINGHIYELDGLKQYPIRHGECSGIDDFVAKVPAVVQDRIAQFGSELRFALLAVTDNRLEHAKAIGDAQGVEHEIIKRDGWAKENQLRRHEYTGLVIELLKNISQGKSDAEFEQWLDGARKRRG